MTQSITSIPDKESIEDRYNKVNNYIFNKFVCQS